MDSTPCRGATVALRSELVLVGRPWHDMFGSRARGDARADSDLDLFIDYDPEARVPNLFRLMQIEEEIAAELGILVTITTRNALHPLMRTRIEQAVRVL